MNNYKIVKSHVIQLNWQFLMFPIKIAKSQIPSFLTIDVKNENKKQNSKYSKAPFGYNLFC